MKSSIQQSSTTATGVTVPADVEHSFAVTQATWRFLANERVTPQALIEPLRNYAQQQLGNDPYVLAIIDWSKVDYKTHTAKKDITQISHKKDIGYELTSQLLASAECGRPIAPLHMHLKTANGFLSTADIPPPADEHHLEQVAPLMQATADLNLSAKVVHVIDREADSVFHLRLWNRLDFQYLIRANDRIVHWNGKQMKCSEVVAQLESEGMFRPSRTVSIRGKSGVQYVAETEIVLQRPARHRVAGRETSIPGEALSLRLVIAKVVDPVSGALLSTWYLLSNVPSDVSSETLALWYYWR